MDEGQILQVRRFNRLVTQRVGALDDSYLQRGRPLGEARVIYEIGSSSGADVRTLRQRLGLDSGYLSRLLRALEAQGLIELRQSEADGRLRLAGLTEQGRVEFEAYDALSDRLAETMLSPLDERQRERLTAAMGEVERILRAGAVTIALEPPDSAATRWCLEQYYAELASRFESGFDWTLGANFDAAEMQPPKGWFVVAWLDGEPVGCGALKRLAPDALEIKRVWTAPAARGLGVASRIVERLEQLGREAGFSVFRLDTNRALAEAHALYCKLGYAEIARYNDNPYADHWFEKRISVE